MAGGGSADIRYSNGKPTTDVDFFNLEDIAVDGDGNLFIANNINASNGSVYKVDANTGTITEIAGGGYYFDGLGDNGPARGAKLDAQSIAIDSEGNLYILDIENSAVRAVKGGAAGKKAGGIGPQARR